MGLTRLFDGFFRSYLVTDMAFQGLDSEIIIPGLVFTIKLALQKAEIAILANVIRNEDTISEFQKSLSKHDLDFKVEIFDKEQMLLYQIRNKN